MAASNCYFAKEIIFVYLLNAFVMKITCGIIIMLYYRSTTGHKRSQSCAKNCRIYVQYMIDHWTCIKDFKSLVTIVTTNSDSPKLN